MNIIDTVQFSYDENDDQSREYLELDSKILSCAISYNTVSNKFDIVDLKIKNGVIRNEITLFFNARVFFEVHVRERNESYGTVADTWVKFTSNLANSYKNNPSKISIAVKPLPRKYISPRFSSYVGKIYFVGVPTLDTLTNTVQPTTINNIIKNGDIVVDQNPNQHLHDVGFKLKDSQNVIFGCKALLAIISPIFNAMFCNNFKESEKDTVIDLGHDDNITEEALGRLVDFSVYRSYDVEKEHNDVDFILLCHKYMITNVVDKWCKFMQMSGTLNKDNVITIFRIANILDNKKLIKECINTIKLNAGSVDLSLFDKDELIVIFSS